MTYQDIKNIVGECEIEILELGVTKINIKNPKMDKLLTLYDYCFNNLSLIYTITTNIDDKLKYQDFIKYKLNLDKKANK